MSNYFNVNMWAEIDGGRDRRGPRSTEAEIDGGRDRREPRSTRAEIDESRDRREPRSTRAEIDESRDRREPRSTRAEFDESRDRREPRSTGSISTLVCTVNMVRSVRIPVYRITPYPLVRDLRLRHAPITTALVNSDSLKPTRVSSVSSSKGTADCVYLTSSARHIYPQWIPVEGT